jgi:hypothetical protein
MDGARKRKLPPDKPMTWELFEKRLCQCGLATRDVGGITNCFFRCILYCAGQSKLDLGAQNVNGLRKLLAAYMLQAYPGGPEPAIFDSMLKAIADAQRNLQVTTWEQYLAALARGKLYGGDLEVGALVAYLRSRYIRLRIKIWTSDASKPEVIEPQVHGDESKDKDVLEWRLAHFGYHYKVVEDAAPKDGTTPLAQLQPGKGLQQQSARAAPPGAPRNLSWRNNFAILSDDTSAWRAPLTTHV